MTISFWRYSHLALAVSSFLFITLASVTGIILAVEPVSQKMQPYRAASFDELTVAKALPLIQEKYTDITQLTVDVNGFVIVQGTNAAGDPVKAYVDPSTGNQLGLVQKQNEFFQWVTSLHRSLFLHELGRFFIGLTAFLLFLIATSGTVLIIQRQRSIKKFFSKITRDGFAQYYHVFLGRLLLLPIIIIAATGTILSLGKFGIIKEAKITHKIDFDAIKSSPKKKPADFVVFQQIKLSSMQRIDFPFSEDPEDYYTLKLKDKELTVNQITGDVLTAQAYPVSRLLTDLSMTLHTGRSSAIWSIVLGIASINILFFIYSGFVMTFKRRSGLVKNKYKADKSKFIVLVGSETGSTFRFAKAVHEQIIKSGQTSFIAELNRYREFPQAEHLVVITATYGSGDAPANAAKFIKLLQSHPQSQQVHFSVVGVGSHAYPDFCQFAFEADNALSQQSWAKPLLEIHTVNDKSPEEFNLWVDQWAQKTGIAVDTTAKEFIAEPLHLEPMKVISKKSLAPAEPYFLLQIEPKERLRFMSGDLLAIYPANDHRERMYSIGKMGRQIQLSVRIHENGLGSNFLHDLSVGDDIAARIVDNKHFRFPQKAPVVIMVSNGTGIAPFLGMIDQNVRKTDCRLYGGFRTASSFELYRDILQDSANDNKLHQLHIAYSREDDKVYVKDLLARDADAVAAALDNKGVIMLCGSLSMQKDVIALLEEICQSRNGQTVSYYQSHGQILMDCY